MLTGFVKADDKKIETANNSFSISMSNSPFQDKKEFKVTAFTYKQVENDGKVDPDAFTNPVLETTIGDMFLSMTTKARVDADGKIIEPNGTFNQFVKDTIAKMPNKPNGEILKAIVEGCENKEIVVSRKPYAKKNKDGVKFAAYAIELNFKD